MTYSNRNSTIDTPSSAGPSHCWYQASSHRLERHHGRGQAGRNKATNRPHTLQSGSDEPLQNNGARLQTPSWMPLWDIGINTSDSLENCPQNHLIAQNSRDNSGTSPSDLFRQLIAKWQQRPPGPALDFRRDALSCTQIALHNCSSWCWERSDFPKINA